MPDNRNFMIAIVLSLAVLFGWTFFISGPQIEQARQQEQAARQQQASESVAGQAGDPAADGIAIPQAGSSTGEQATSQLPTDTAVGATGSRESALAKNGRVTIASDLLSGSINLTGARIDDLRLNDYRETVDDGSPTIILLSPSGGPDGYFAEFGWQAPESAGEVPGAATIWTAPSGATLTPETPVDLRFDNGAGLVFTRTIALDEAYMFTVIDKVINRSAATADLSAYGRLTRIGEPETTGFWILFEGLIGVFGEDGVEEEKYSKIVDAGEKTWASVPDGWLGITDKYWATALIPDPSRPFDGRFVHSGDGTGVFQADFRQGALTVAPGESFELTNRLFAGAKVVAIVDGYRDLYEITLFDRLIDWGWFFFITKPLFSVIDFFFDLFGNFGVAILAATVIIKAGFFPLASKSYRSMSAMRKLQPQMTELREKFKDDKAKQQQALMALYKKEKINPVAGCWPIAIQIPVFFALYKVLFVTIEMRHAPFFGWIQDLAAPDPTSIFNLFGLIPWDPPSLLVVGVWPLIMGFTMFIQMKLNPTPPDPTQAMIFTWMPIVFTFMLASFPAGLVIYWAWNNTLSVTQQYVIMRRNGVTVDLFGNIMSTFRRGAAAASASATAAVAPARQPEPVKATAEAEPAKPAKRAKRAKPVDPKRKVRPKNSPKRRKSRSRTAAGDKPSPPA